MAGAFPRKKRTFFDLDPVGVFGGIGGESGAEWRSREEIYSSHTSTTSKVFVNKYCGELFREILNS